MLGIAQRTVNQTETGTLIDVHGSLQTMVGLQIQDAVAVGPCPGLDLCDELI